MNIKEQAMQAFNTARREFERAEGCVRWDPDTAMVIGIRMYELAIEYATQYRVPEDVCRSLAKLFDKIDAEDKNTVNWLIAAGKHVATQAAYAHMAHECRRASELGTNYLCVKYEQKECSALAKESQASGKGEKG